MFLLDFEGDLYGRRLVVELWMRSDERAFESEQDLIDQIALDVDETRRAVLPLPSSTDDLGHVVGGQGHDVLRRDPGCSEACKGRLAPVSRRAAGTRA